jgi:hypothetical protein
LYQILPLHRRVIGPARHHERRDPVKISITRRRSSWPADGLDPYQLAAGAQVIRVIAMVAAKVGVEAARERDRERALAALSPGLRARLRDGAAPET